jgi:HD-GYP domain-containing protein (c-di-GMP phosphodiesterase class II)
MLSDILTLFLYKKSQFIKMSESGEYLQEIENAYIQLMIAAAGALETHESYLYGHNERVALFACETARLFGFSPDEIDQLRMAAICQDIGEITIPTYILQKATKLTDEEWGLIRDHPRISADLVSKIKSLQPVAEIVFSHQEKFDGTGYPRALKGDEIPLGARILCVVNTYDAMTNIRLHRETGNHENAIKEIMRLSGTHYDPEVVEKFLQLF